MKPNEVEKGGFYVMKQTGIIRHFYDLTPSGMSVLYRAYDPYDGRLIMVCHSAIEEFVYRAERRATAEEISKLTLWKVDEPYMGRGMALREALRTTKG